MLEISVLVPICNVEPFVAQCLESILAQTFSDFEVICVDDGSSDRSGEIADTYAAKDGRIHVIHKENTGYGHSMNVGLSAAKGNYIAVIESDDYAEPDMLKILHRAAAEHEAEIVKAEFFRHREGKDFYGNRLADYPKNRPISFEECPQILGLADTIWSCLYRRSFLEEHDIRFHETPGASFQDISFALQGWASVKRAVFLDDAVIHYRTDNPGQSMKNPYKIFNVFEEYAWFEEKYAERIEKNPVLRYRLAAVKYMDFIVHYFRVAPHFQYALLVRLDELLRKDMDAGLLKRELIREKDWEYLSMIKKDRNVFFAKTAKGLPDSRMAFGEFQNDAARADAVCKALGDYNVSIIYGAGKVGQGLARHLLTLGVTNFVFAATNPAPGERCMDRPVAAIESLAGHKDDGAVILAVAELNQYELYQNVKRIGFRSVFRVDPQIRARL